MRLASIREFRSLIYTPQSAPTLATLRARIDRGEIAGGRRDGNRYYVDLDAHDAATNFAAGVLKKRDELARHPDLQRLL